MAKKNEQEVVLPEEAVATANGNWQDPDGDNVPKETPRPAEPDRIALERELRAYVKRAGGFRKGLSAEKQKRARVLLKLLVRKNLVWDTELIPTPALGS